MRAGGAAVLGEVVHLPHVHTVPGELRARGLNVVDDEVHPTVRTGRAGGTNTLADGDRTRRSRRSHLHNAEVVADFVVDVEVEADLLRIEVLGPIDVRHGQDDELELPIHDCVLS